MTAALAVALASFAGIEAATRITRRYGRQFHPEP